MAIDKRVLIVLIGGVVLAGLSSLLKEDVKGLICGSAPVAAAALAK